MSHSKQIKTNSGGESEAELSTDDSIKRKRELNREPEIFKRSKKIVRTPNKGTESGDKNYEMDELTKMMSGIMSEIKAFRKENQENIEELKKQNEILKKQNEELKQEIITLKGRVTQLEQMEQRVEGIEKDKRKNNILISGVKIKDKTKGEITETMKNLLTEHVDVNADITKVSKINDNMCIIELEEFETKLEILRKKAKVRHLRENRIFITADLTKKEREIQKIIRDRAKLERQNGNTVKVGYQNIIINGQEWKWSKKENKLNLKITNNTLANTSKN